jgi:hypothetical protein
VHLRVKQWQRARTWRRGAICYGILSEKHLLYLHMNVRCVKVNIGDENYSLGLEVCLMLLLALKKVFDVLLVHSKVQGGNLLLKIASNHQWKNYPCTGQKFEALAIVSRFEHSTLRGCSYLLSLGWP